jgi:hypothetical protein
MFFVNVVQLFEKSKTKKQKKLFHFFETVNGLKNGIFEKRIASHG